MEKELIAHALFLLLVVHGSADHAFQLFREVQHAHLDFQQLDLACWVIVFGVFLFPQSSQELFSGRVYLVSGLVLRAQSVSECFEHLGPVPWGDVIV